jgi:hypothetical protein
MISMMREFNTSGPCDPTLHYTVMREALIAKGKEKVYKGRYFTIFAPRQSGKTTYFQLLLNELKDEGYIPIWISFESLKTLPKERFYTALNKWLKRGLARQNVTVDYTISDALDLGEFFASLKDKTDAIVLVIDEFEGIPDAVLNEVMHTFRRIYHQKDAYALQSLILVGVSTIADLVLSSASPFNVADELEVDYFTFAEVQALIQQYTAESGQPFTPGVVKAIYHNTQGQPGLVCALCHHLVTKVATDTDQPVTMEHFYATQKAFLYQRLHKNIINIVQKAREKRDFILKLLFRPEPVPFSIYDPDIGWLHAHGVVDDVEGYVDVAVPLYKKVLIAAFRPLINGETRYYLTSPHDTFSQYIHADGRLNINALLEAYRAYVRRRGFRAFDTQQLKEGAWHYSLDGFINFFIERMGGQTYIEVPSGRGRTDILIRHQRKSHIIETKIFSDPSYFKQGKGQLAAYLTSEGLDEGYYVVFSRLHTEADTLYTEETIAGKQIYTHIIPISFEQPSRLPVPGEVDSRR